MINEICEKWKNISAPHQIPLKRTLLRNLNRQIHAQKSALLIRSQNPTPSESEFGTISNLNLIEETIENLKNKNLDFLDLKLILDQNISRSLAPQTSIKKLDRILPESILKIIPEEKINRFDRQWEKEILLDAIELKWKLGTLTAQMSPFEVEKFHHNLEEKLWPNGIVLWVDQARLIDSAHWEGSWWILLSPGESGTSAENNLQQYGRWKGHKNG